MVVMAVGVVVAVQSLSSKKPDVWNQRQEVRLTEVLYNWSIMIKKQRNRRILMVVIVITVATIVVVVAVAE